MDMTLKDVTCQLSLKLNSHLFQVMVLNLLLPVWRWVTVELPCVNFTEVLTFERSGILVIPETVHRSVFYIGNVLMFAFSVFLFCMVLGHRLSKEKLGFDC